MQTVTSRMPASDISNIIELPVSFLNGDVEVTVKPVSDPTSVVDSLWGCASNLDISAEELREERMLNEVTD